MVFVIYAAVLMFFPLNVAHPVISVPVDADDGYHGMKAPYPRWRGDDPSEPLAAETELVPVQGYALSCAVN